MSGAATEVAVTSGWVEPGFEQVRQEFERNFEERGELGAAFSVFHQGRPVVDLWGGLAAEDPARPWQEETIQNFFSGTKALVASCLLILVDRGQLDINAPVASYWPEFAVAGKDRIRVAEVAAHNARLPGIRQRVSDEEILDSEAMAALVAAQAPEDDPRARGAYHPLTYGWLCDELIRRIDGRSAGHFFAEEIAGPLGLEIWIGLPKKLEARVATLSYGPAWGATKPGPEAYERDELLDRVWNNPQLFPPTRIPWSSPEFRTAEIPGANAIGSARSMARLFGFLALSTLPGAVRVASSAAVAMARQVRNLGWDWLRSEPASYGFGFELQTRLRRLGPPAGAFGHSGAGGSVHGSWPEQGVGFSYCMNQMRDDAPVDERPHALLKALFESLVESRADRRRR